MLDALRRAAERWITRELMAGRITADQSEDALDRVAAWHATVRRWLRLR